MKEHCKQIAQRLADADAWLIDIIADAGKVSCDDAAIAAKYYLKHKLVKRDLTFSKYQFKHGGLLDADVIAQAVALNNSPHTNS